MKIHEICLFFVTLICLSSGDYWSIREHLIANDNSQMLGSKVVLNAKEKIVNEFLMKLKLSEYEEGFNEPRKFLPGRHFFEARSAIEESEVYKFIKKMPKGGALHGHDTALVSFEALYGFTREKHLHACIVNNTVLLRFMLTPAQESSCEWKLVEDLRVTNRSYDNWLRSQLTLDTKNPKEAYKDINQVWSTFSKIFKTVKQMITYRPVLQRHVYQALKELYDDQVMYLELRGSFSSAYELNGTTYTKEQVADIYYDVISSFKRDHPSFFGAKYIYAAKRNMNENKIKDHVNAVNTLHRLHPDFVIGFDLVGQEDKGKPLYDFVEKIKHISKNVSLVFHAGETNWYGTKSDFNLFDAILLGTKRIGHGFGITKHPALMQLVKDLNIAIEVCPISNQVLMLVQDLRNHPAAYLIGRGFPIVVSNDDPGFWSAKGLSYDFYVMFMGIASRNADLKLLKQLAENSLIYSLLSKNEKKRAIEQWNQMWNKFIELEYENLTKHRTNSSSGIDTFKN